MWNFYVVLGPTTRLSLFKSRPVDSSWFHKPPPYLVIQDKGIAQGPFQVDVGATDGQYLSAKCYQGIMAAAISCHDSHTECDRDQNDPCHSMAFRLIDVHTKTFVLATGGEQYVALSYVWGDTARHTPRSFDTLPEELPQTIADAISVVHNLGIQYIWIDAYCIDQSNSLELSQAVANMDSVFESAFLTLCPLWADIHHGLQGVSMAFESPQAYPLGNHHVCWAYGDEHPLDEGMRNTPWHNRAWIFQESMLSRLRLCFLRSSVLLSCPWQRMSSHYHMCGPIDPAKHQSDDSIKTHLQMTKWRFYSYSILVSRYSRRQLTYASDALNAIKGILSRITKQTGMEFVHGLPQSDLLNGLLWHPSFIGDYKDETPHEQPAMVNTNQRGLFPSWSWLSYSRSVDFAYLERNSTLITYPLHARWRTSINTLDQECFIRDTAQVHASNSSALLTIITESISVIMVPDLADEESPNDMERFQWVLEPPVDGGKTTAVRQSKRERPFSWSEPAYFESVLIPVEILPRLCIGPGRCAVRLLQLVRIVREKEDIVIAMAVGKAENGVLERLGLLVVPYEYWVGRGPEQRTGFIQ